MQKSGLGQSLLGIKKQESFAGLLSDVLWYLHTLDPIGVQKSETTSRRQIQKNHREGGSSAELVARDGIDPPTRGFSLRCSTN